VRQQGLSRPDVVSETPAEMALRFTEFEGGLSELVRVGEDGDHQAQQQIVHGGGMRSGQHNGGVPAQTFHFLQDALSSRHGSGGGSLRFGQQNGAQPGQPHMPHFRKAFIQAIIQAGNNV
jgi:hypothetical protein